MKIEIVKKLLKKNGINPVDFKKFSLEYSVTNQFIKVIDDNKKEYLVRVNGRLWEPFSRLAESYNLKQLKENKVETGVLINAPILGLQICKFYDQKNKLSQNNIAQTNEKIFYQIGKAIKKIHQIKNYEGEFHLGQTINNGFRYLPSEIKAELTIFYEIIMRIALTVSNNKQNHVFSHNDLLSSSIYSKKDNDIKIVDFEYAGANCSEFDLAFFSEKSKLSFTQEQKLIEGYAPKTKTNFLYGLAIIKPAIHFLLLIWGAKTLQNLNPSQRLNRYHVLKNRIEGALISNTSRTLTNKINFGLFFEHKKHPLLPLDNSIALDNSIGHPSKNSIENSIGHPSNNSIGHPSNQQNFIRSSL